MTKVIIAAVLMVGFAVASAANAADVGLPVYKAPPPPPVPDWSGFYVGLEGGYGWGKQSTVIPSDPFSPVVISLGSAFTLTPPVFFPGVAVPSIKENGWLFGGFFGAQKQWGNLVLGIEGDIDGANIKGSGTSNASSASRNFILLGTPDGQQLEISCGASPCFTLSHNVSIQSKIDALASLRGKVGWSFAPNWLIYGTGGAAFARVENTVVSTETADVANLMAVCRSNRDTCIFPPNSSRNASGGTAKFGWALGGGVDWKHQMDAGSALVLGVEYLHYGFPEQTITLSDNAGGILAFKSKESVDAVKGRISYLFSIH